MELSEKRKSASRANSLLGGVKTEEGKDISSRNAIKHGVLAHCITKYDQLDVEQVYHELSEEFDDCTPSRRFLVQQLALITIRLARCVRAETELLREALNPPVKETRYGYENISFKRTVIVSEGEPATISPKELEKLALVYERYEPRFFSRYLKILTILREKQRG